MRHPGRFGLTVATVLITAAAVTTSTGGWSPAQAVQQSVDHSGTARSSGSSLGNGLDRLVAGDKTRPQARTTSASPINPAKSAIRDSHGRVLVDLTPQAGANRTAFRQQAERAGLAVTATDAGRGTLEGYVAVADVGRLSALPATGALAQVPKGATAAGRVLDQGVAFQNVDKVLKKGIDGRGITVAVLSDSYDTSGDPIDAAADVASGDLPGVGNKENPQPVVVLSDFPGGSDEGRGMLQIVHDMAPKAKLCFATSSAGEVQFANNIRALADPRGACRADVIVDDYSYFDEPFFSDGVVGDAVNAVTAAGVSYFSDALNSGEHGAWRAPVNLVPAAKALKGRNLDFSDVPASLYDGGLQDFDTGPGIDPAQTYALNDGGNFDLQWDDPFDADGPDLGTPYFTASGHISASAPAPKQTYTPTADQLGKQVQVKVDGVPSGGPDLILTVTKPDGTVLGPVDTGSSPESTYLTLDQAGAYTITTSLFSGTTADYTTTVRPVTGPSQERDDFNVLLFGMDGSYRGALAEDNRLSGIPAELASLDAGGQIQVVISRSGTGPLTATTLAQISFNGLLSVDEYWSPTAPATFGHQLAAGSQTVAAYDPFQPYLPEPYTSPGGYLPVRFDSSGRAYRHVQRRQVPAFAATDGADTTFFGSPRPIDGNALPNFGGTSAAAPHAAGIAALVLQRHGGRRSVSPARMRSTLQRATFAHDLDPFVSHANLGPLQLAAVGSQSEERDNFTGANADPNFFRVSYTGRLPLTSITLDARTADPTALGGRGLVFDTRPYTDPTHAYEQGFPFTVGSTSRGLSRSSITATFAGDPGPQGVAGQYSTMTLHFGNGGLRAGQSFTFGVDRDLAISGYGSPRLGDGADEIGGGVFYPSQQVRPLGMQVTTTTRYGRYLFGWFTNRLGSGYSVVDGLGLIDAQRAVR